MAVKTVDFDPKLFHCDAYGNLRRKLTRKEIDIHRTKVRKAMLQSPFLSTILNRA